MAAELHQEAGPELVVVKVARRVVVGFPASRSDVVQAGIYWERRLSFALIRYNKALETLARIRRLNLTVQVNVAHNQVVRNG